MRYRNLNTGDEVETEGNDPRLDRLAHRWERLDDEPAEQPDKPKAPTPNRPAQPARRRRATS